MYRQFTSSPGYVQISSATEDEQGRLRHGTARGTLCHGSDAVLPLPRSVGIWVLFSPKANVMHCPNHSVFAKQSILWATSPNSVYLPKQDMHKPPLDSFVSLFILIKIFVRGIYCLFSIFCSDVAVLDITLWSMRTQNINASHSRKIHRVCSTVLTFSVHCILINWPPCFCPTGLQGQRETKRWKSYQITFLITGKVRGVW